MTNQYPCAFSGIFASKPAWILRILLLILPFSALLSACGFTLRGTSALPYETVAVTAPGNSQLAADLRRNLAATSNAKVVEDANTAALDVQVLSELRDKQVLSINEGRVREYTLYLRVMIKAVDPQGKEVLAPTEFVQKRDVSFNEGVVLAKEGEEAQLYREMQADIMQSIVRRIAAIPAAKS